MTKIYLIVNKYDREAYYIYDKKIYTDLAKAKKSWKRCLRSFLSIGPDDVNVLSLVECCLTDNKLAELKTHLKNYIKDPYSYSYNEKFYNFMDNHANVVDNAIYGPEGYETCEEICEAIEEADKDMQDNKVFNRYFNKYYKENYEEE